MAKTISHCLNARMTTALFLSTPCAHSGTFYWLHNLVSCLVYQQFIQRLEHNEEWLLPEMKTDSTWGVCVTCITHSAGIITTGLSLCFWQYRYLPPSLLRSAFMSKRKPVALLPWLPYCWCFLFISSPHLAFDLISPV